MGGRTMPTKCEHGRTVDRGDFGEGIEPEPCPECDAAQADEDAYVTTLETAIEDAFKALTDNRGPVARRHLAAALREMRARSA